MSNKPQGSSTRGGVRYPPVWPPHYDRPQHTSVPRFIRTKIKQERGRTEVEGRLGAAGDRMKKRVGTSCNTSCRDLSEDTWAPGSTRWEQRTRETHTSITETNRLPSALVVVPSLSQLKNKGGDNREQLVTFRKLKSRMLLATQKAKCTL